MQPDLILIPFGKNATPGTIDTIPKTRGPGDDPQQATWDEGFPQVTMTPLAAGGIPPKGQDFNGVLNAISEHTVFTEHGGQFKWSSDYVAESGGYSIGDVVQADDGLNSYVSLVNTNTVNFNTTPASIGTAWGFYAGRNTQTQATESVSGIAKVSTTSEATTGTDDATIMTPLKVAQALATQVSTYGIAGSHSNLKISTTGTSAPVTITADSVCVKNATFGQKVLNAVSLSASLAVSGANGLDTGASTVSTWYSVWVIWNGTTVASLLSLSATAPTMPGGYTHKARIGWVRSDATVNKFPLSYNQAGNRAQYKVAAGSNVTAKPTMASSGVDILETAVSVVNFVPATASSIITVVSLGTAAAGTFSVYVGPSVGDTITSGMATVSTLPGQYFQTDILLQASTIGWNVNASSTGSATLFCDGWVDNL